MAGRHNIEVPSTVTTVGRALVTLEGLLDEFIPDVNMIEIISDHIATSKSLKNATKDEIKSLGVEGHQALHATLGTMTELKTVARMLTRGQLRVNMELVGSEEPFQLLSDMVNRLTMALIVVGLFVGSSIVYYAGMKPIIFGIPVIGFMGYVVAFALGVWIVIDIYLKGRKPRSGRASIDISPAEGGFALDKVAVRSRHRDAGCRRWHRPSIVPHAVRWFRFRCRSTSVRASSWRSVPTSYRGR